MADKTYTYSGYVLDGFGHVLDTNWYGQTMAPSLKKAWSNLKYQFKKDREMPMHARIDMPEKLVFDEE